MRKTLKLYVHSSKPIKYTYFSLSGEPSFKILSCIVQNIKVNQIVHYLTRLTGKKIDWEFAGRMCGHRLNTRLSSLMAVENSCPEDNEHNRSKMSSDLGMKSGSLL